MKKSSLVIVCFSFLIILLYFISIFLPSSYQISQTEFIYGTPKTTFQLFNNLKNWKHWNVWVDSSSKYAPTYSPKFMGDGAFLKWRSSSNNYNTIEIKSAEPNTKIDFLIRTLSADSIVAQLNFEELEDGTQVEWNMTLHFKDSGARLMGFLIYRWFVRDIKKSLRNINPYLFDSHQHSGWSSDSFYIENTIGKPSLYSMDTILPDSFYRYRDSIAKRLKTYHDKTTQDENFYFFYQKLATLNDGKIVVVFGSPILDGVKNFDSLPIKYFDGKYMVYSYYGSEEGYPKVVQKAKVAAKKNGWSINPEPYISYSDYFKLKNELDTSLMKIGFLIH
ncbi:MAG: hypothetical protein M9958_11425 [Chitinophagales bacterium]|nr:hypothetical protein [Chitinophagales bacterium]